MLSKSTFSGDLGRIFSDAEAYIYQLFGVRMKLKEADTSLLPFFVTDRYRLVETSLFGRKLLVLATPGHEADTPATIAKHISIVRSTLNGHVVVLLTDVLSSPNRQRLIKQGVNFIVPGNQLFIPELGTDLREYFRSAVPRSHEQLTPAAQALVLATLLGENLNGQTPKSLAERFRYSSMSTGRIVDELKQHGILDVAIVGRERHIAFVLSGDDLWRTLRPLFQSPVRAHRLVRSFREIGNLPLAGESALSDYSNLSPPLNEVRAVSARQWKALVNRCDLQFSDEDDPEAVRIETWSYDPRLLCHHATVVDRLSLYLSLGNRGDERFEQATETLLEPFGWS